MMQKIFNNVDGSLFIHLEWALQLTVIWLDLMVI